MILSELKLYNFRKFKSVGNDAGLSITFHKGLNALIGENDSGKTAVIDAIKLVLLTQSNEYIRPTDDDFYIDNNGVTADEFRIECMFDDFSENEAKNFIEYLNIQKSEEKTIYSMHLYYKAWKEKNRVFSELRVGDAVDGVIMDGRARELLKTVYLKPLRDAEREMSSGRNSRISQILLGHPVFSKQDSHKLIDILKDANQNIEKYFSEDDGKEILNTIKSTLDAFNESNSTSDARFETSEYQLKAILESLSLTVPEIHPGLGELNLLFMAAELLLLKHDDNGGLKLALIEELEAHLHPQAQLRLISYLQNEYNESGAQIIVSTHSTILASKINLKNIVLFPYVFVDEYQDCDQNQRDALAKIFDSSKCCVLHIGDPDQAIYTSDIEGVEDWKPEAGHLSIAFSCRYGQEIADVLKTLRSGQRSIYTAAGPTGFQPTVIVYDDDTRSQVVSKYIQLLDDNNLDNPDGVYKVIGAVKNRELKGLKISDYWEEFDDSSPERKDYRYWSYIDEISQACSHGKMFEAEQNIRKLLCRIFHYLGEKNQDTGKEFSTSSIKQILDKKYFDEYRNFLMVLSKLEDYTRESVDSHVKGLLQTLCEKKIEVIIAALPAHFLRIEDVPSIEKGTNSFVEPLRGRRIQFDTIHGVKGETHDATLILETERSRCSDIKSILTFFGLGNARKSSDYNRKCLYVGMSRPRKLLCIAIQTKTYEAGRDVFNNWKLIDCRKK